MNLPLIVMLNVVCAVLFLVSVALCLILGYHSGYARPEKRFMAIPGMAAYLLALLTGVRLLGQLQDLRAVFLAAVTLLLGSITFCIGGRARVREGFKGREGA